MSLMLMIFGWSIIFCSLFYVQAMDMLSRVQGSLPIIFLVTDGSVEDERHICDTVKKHMINKESICPRIYTFGIGMVSNVPSS